MRKRRAVPISDLLGDVRRKLRRSKALARIERDWKDAVGENWAAMSRPKSLRAGSLKVEVPSNAALQEFGTLRRAEFLERVRRVEPRIVEVTFTVGDGPWSA